MIFQFIKQNIGLIVAILAGLYLYKNYSSNLVEGWATSPATLIQLSASSSYYPFWRYGYGWRYPYYRYMYPYYAYNPTYSGYYNRGHFPRPFGYYNYY